MYSDRDARLRGPQQYICEPPACDGRRSNGEGKNRGGAGGEGRKEGGSCAARASAQSWHSARLPGARPRRSQPSGPVFRQRGDQRSGRRWPEPTLLGPNRVGKSVHECGAVTEIGESERFRILYMILEFLDMRNAPYECQNTGCTRARTLHG